MKKHYFTALLAVLPFLGFAQPANDDCANATALTVSTTTTFTSPLTGTLQNATASGVAVACTGVADDDVWYTFTASATRLALSTSNVTSTAPGLNAALRIEIYSGSCSGTLVSCYNTYNNINFIDGLTVSTTYYIRVFTNAGVTTPTPLVNFTLALATPLASIAVAEDEYTVPELVQDVLWAGTGLSMSNITWSTGTNVAVTEPNGIAYFEQNGSSFPFSNGIILSSGSAAAAEGPNGNAQSNGGNALWAGDADLNTILNLNGALATKNASKLEFDFVPNADNISLNFIFASEEYGGAFQCNYTDGMGIFLTNTETDMVTNIAVVPGTSYPISVQKVNNTIYSGNLCPSNNPDYFGEYYEPLSMQGPINFNGRTVPLTAEAAVMPGHSYHLKIVVADGGDYIYDSAIFLEAGSFTSGPVFDDAIIVPSIDTPFINCEFSPAESSIFHRQEVAGLIAENTADYTFAWFLTYADAMENSNPLPVVYAMSATEQIVYMRVIANENPNAFDIVTITLKAEPLPWVNDSVVHTLCDGDGVSDGQTAVDLTAYIPEILGTQNPNDVDLIFYASFDDALSGTNPVTVPESYVTATGTAAFSAQFNNATSTCVNYGQVVILISTLPEVNIISANGGQGICTDANGQVTEVLVLESGIAAGNGFSWYFNGEVVPSATGPTLVATQAGEYGLVVHFSNIECTSPMATFTVTASGLATEVGSGYTVDGNQITVNVQGLGNYTYSLALAGPYQESNILTASAPGIYSVYVNDANGCGIHIIANIEISAAPPVAAENQAYVEGQTLADLIVVGENIQWYADAEGTQPLPLSTVLEEGVTYYVTQTINGVESETYPITVFSITGLNGNGLSNLRCYPNPVKDEVTLQHTATLISATLYNTLGQEVLSAQINNTAATLNLRSLADGVYLMKVTAENGEKQSR